MKMQQQTRGPCKIGAPVIAALHVLCLHSGATAEPPGTTEELTALGASTTLSTNTIVLFDDLVVLYGAGISGPSTDSPKNGFIPASSRLLQQVQVDLSIPYNIVLGHGFDADLRGQLLQSQTWIAYRLAATTLTNGRPILQTLRDSNPRLAGTNHKEGEPIVVMINVGEAFNLSWQDAMLNKWFASETSSQYLSTRKQTPRVYHFEASAPVNGTMMLDALGNSSAWFDLRIGSTFLLRNYSNVKMANTAAVSVQVSSPVTLGTRPGLIGQAVALGNINSSTANLEGNDYTSMNGNLPPGQREMVPEPAALIALGLGLALLIARRFRH